MGAGRRAGARQPRPGEEQMTCEMCGRPIDRANSLLVDLEAGIDEPGEEDWIWVCEQCAAEIDATQEAPELSETERTPAGFARRQGARS